jgi:hypothetical protein
MWHRSGYLVTAPPAEATAEVERLHAELHRLDMTLRYGDARCPACKSYRANAYNVTTSTDANRKATQ